MQRQALGSSEMPQRGFGLREDCFKLSLCLCPSLSPLSEILELEPRTLSLTKELALHRSNMCLHLTWVAWGKSVEFWILIYLSNRDKKYPNCRAGIVCVTNSRECVLQMLMVAIEANNIPFPA